LPRVHLEVSATPEHSEQGDAVRVQLHNPSHSLAFQIHLGIHEEKSEDEILPVFWEDNYLSLMPDESRIVVAHYTESHKLEGHPQLEVNGWNVDAPMISLTAIEHEAVK
jgi:hypothetical protein